jgi:hypothetical protein
LHLRNPSLNDTPCPSEFAGTTHAGSAVQSPGVTLAVCAIALLSSVDLVQAATPANIDFELYSTTDEGRKYAQYTVKCSNGQSRLISAWDNRHVWCVGDGLRENCFTRQLAAAQAACANQ